ncbi:MAG: hypothetical protein K2K93_01810, partial [Muribaculaceae bacterium]|nr:hypothetical protein [Muribaculaceae bacterium]
MEELEIMRRQLASMKEQLRSQHIVNESLMRKVMKGKASWMNTLVKAEIICVPITWILLAAICAFYGISQWYASLFLIMSVIDTYIDWYTVRIGPAPVWYAHLRAPGALVSLGWGGGLGK